MLSQKVAADFMTRLKGPRLSYKYNRFSIVESETKKSKMSNFSDEFIEKIIGFMAEGNWGGFFDELDVNKDGTLSHQEFWKCETIGDSSELMDALDKFDVSFNFLGR